MDSEISNILESNETSVWEGVINRKALVTRHLFFLLLVLVMSGIFFLQQTIHYTSNGQAKDISGVFVAIGVLFLGLFILLFSFLSDYAKSYAITKKRVIIKSGLIGTDFKSIPFDQIKNIIVDVGLMGKIFDVGSVKIDIGEMETYSSDNRSARSSYTQIKTRVKYDVLKYVDDPYEVYKYLQKTLEGRKESLYSGRADRESNPQAYK